MSKNQEQKKALVIGGSISGLSCAHVLLSSGWKVTVIEKSSSPPSKTPTGAGLSLDSQSMEIICSWLSDQDKLQHFSLPLHIELLQIVDCVKKDRKVVARDDCFNYRCFHWTDLHSLLYRSLPPNIVLWDHHFVSLNVSENKDYVGIEVEVPNIDAMKQFSADLLIAADGSMSMIRQKFLPEHKLRYSGYSAWRGVYDYSEDINSNSIDAIRRVYPELGKCLYFDFVYGNHCVIYELKGKRINWVWYYNTPEADIKGRSVTIKVSPEMIEKMHEEASRIWGAELALLMRETKNPFINVIYDSDPLPKLFWDNVVLVGDAAHPTTPHCSRSTNMSILDAEVLGLSLKKWGKKNLGMALQEFQSIRYPVISSQVLHSRHCGRLKQELLIQNNKVFDTKGDSKVEIDEIQHKSLPFFYKVPVCLD